MPLTADTSLLVLVLDVVLTGLVLLWVFDLIRGTRAARLVFGVAILYAAYAVANLVGLHLLSQVMSAGALVGAVALVVIFSPELRRGLERLGRAGSLTWLFRPPATALEHSTAELARAAFDLVAVKQGGLIVVQRETSLVSLAEAGVPLHADLTAELLLAIFQPPGPLHDGAVIVRGDHIVVAGLALPLSETTAIGEERLGTRHRAALGLSEQSDALVIVVSEEKGRVSLAERGRLVRDLDQAGLREALRERLMAGAPEHETDLWPRLRSWRPWRSR